MEATFFLAQQELVAVRKSWVIVAALATVLASDGWRLVRAPAILVAAGEEFTLSGRRDGSMTCF